MVYYYPCFRWRIRDRSRSGISQALKSILQSSTSTQPSFPRFLHAGFYVIGGSQSLRRRTSRLPLWQHPCKYFIRKCRTLQNSFRLFSFPSCQPGRVDIPLSAFLRRHCPPSSVLSGYPTTCSPTTWLPALNLILLPIQPQGSLLVMWFASYQMGFPPIKHCALLGALAVHGQCHLVKIV